MSEAEFVAWYRKWHDGRVPGEPDWQEFFAADSDGDGVLSHAEFAAFADARGFGAQVERERFYAEVSEMGQHVHVERAPPLPPKLGTVAKEADEDGDVLVRWDEDETETYVRVVALRFADPPPQAALLQS